MSDWSRRGMLLGGASLAACSALAKPKPVPGPVSPPSAPVGSPGQTIPLGPIARVEPVSETFFGQTVVDPYRWMENPKDPDWAPFMKANADHARAILDAIPGLPALKTRVSELSGAFETISSVVRVGAKVFYEKRPAGAQSSVLFVRDLVGGPETALVDPNSLKTQGVHSSLDWWLPSPDGAHVVYGLSPSGSENSVLHVMRVADRVVLPERIDRTQYASPSWLPDGKGFIYNRLSGAPAGSQGYYLDSVCWLHRIGQDPARDVKILARGQYPEVDAEPTDFPFVYMAPGSAFALGVMFGGVRRENPIWTARIADLLAGRPKWRRACTIADQVVAFTLRRDDLYMITTSDAENGRVVKTSAAAPSFAAAREIVPASDVVIDSINAARDGLYLVDMDGGYNRVRRLPFDKPGAAPEVLALPFDGAVFGLDANPADDGARMLLTSWLQPTAAWRFEPAGPTLSNLNLTTPPPIDVSGFEAIRTYATARDGVRVPISIIARKGAPRDGSAPTLVSAYGAYQISSSPAYSPRSFAFLEQGGVVATAHVRGGGEYGKRWWKAGQKATKPNTWRDLIDCCEHLVQIGFTSPGKLAIIGGSAGGITIGRALTERPDLFCAALPLVGCLNALRLEFSQNGPPNIVEFGSVASEEGFRALLAMDALHAVRDGVKYPAVLLQHGMNDPRVEPWNSAKMVARLRAADPQGGPFLLRVGFDSGHGLGSTRAQRDSEVADGYAFVLWRAGAAGVQPA